VTVAGFPLTPIAPAAYAVLAEANLGPELFNPRQHRACELAELYALQHAIGLVDRLGLAALLAAPRTIDEILAAAGFVPAFRPALAWVLERLADALLVARDAGRFRLPAALPTPALDAVRAAGLAEDPSYAPAYTLLDEAAALYPRVARGETSGERALFLRASLWAAYFDNRNGYYALSNRVAAHAVATRLPRGARVLEVGAGLGSATAALLEALAASDRVGDVAACRTTEPVVFFRRRAERTLRGAWPAAPLAFDALDVNAPWAAQGVGAATQDVVWGVNVFHLAHDLDAVLREAHTALAPGGWLVVGEGLRPAPERRVGAEMPFQLLESFSAVRLDPATRPTPGFLAAEHWLAALARAGFAPVEIVPDAIRLRAYYPGFVAAAIVGRRPS
jgi:SAM-dependent methyltransferase